ncbi:zinc finger CCCH domain-containing protein 6-like [Alnus glutinosa]|uniref:zinc finger CCCH domain-containing protein 6-like n=1 Tax=Alnus glutinosa TaxID=3517 RepID=UPI002D780155|nr:zinc finger CCCH domain-containing protein 6-like [Alnus glutinosa]
MKRSRKSKRVSWAPGVVLCQVKLFSSEDCPAKVGLKCEDHLQAKTSLHSNRMESNDLPPGFEQGSFENHLKKELSHVGRINWKCPPKFVIGHNWQVVAGEESTEVEAQKLRETRVLEAVYPRSSAIPPSPSVSLDIEREHYDDSLTPLVPVTPIEDDESSDIPSDLTVPGNNPVCSPPVALPQGLAASGTMNTPKSSTPATPTNEKPVLGSLPSMGADAAAAASTALAALLESREHGSLIDTDLLINILSDPKMIQKLINDHQSLVNTVIAPANMVSAPSGTAYESKLVTPIIHTSSTSKPAIQSPGNGNLYQVLNAVRPQQPETGLKRVIPSVALSCPEPNLVLLTKPANGNLYTAPNQVRAAYTAPKSTPTFMEAQAVKDANYYKDLIRQHGGEKQETQEPMIAQNGNHFKDLKLVQNIKPGEVKPKGKKRCMYFNSPKGCRNGLSCPYQHDVSCQSSTGSILEVPSAKRMRLGGEIAGRI